MRSVQWAVAAVWLLAVGAAQPAAAEEYRERDGTAVRLGVGADYLISRDYTFSGSLENSGVALFELTLSVEQRVLRHLSIGGRVGGLITTGSGGSTFGIPIDLDLRLHMADDFVYLEGLVGPWIFFSQPTFRGHVALGFGLNFGSISLGAEFGYLDPAPMVGLRVAFRF